MQSTKYILNSFRVNDSLIVDMQCEWSYGSHREVIALHDSHRNYKGLTTRGGRSNRYTVCHRVTWLSKSPIDRIMRPISWCDELISSYDYTTTRWYVDRRSSIGVEMSGARSWSYYRVIVIEIGIRWRKSNLPDLEASREFFRGYLANLITEFVGQFLHIRCIQF